ncbi:sodium/hydrogen exchanger 4 [Tanacetum coccineum]
MALPLLSFDESTSENISRAKENISMLMERPVYTIHSYWRRFTKITLKRKWYCIFLMNGFNVVVLLAAAPAVHVTQGLLIRHEKSSTKGLDYLYQRYDLLRGEMVGL